MYLIPGIGWAVECPHCGKVKQIQSTLLFDWWEEGDDELRYYVFHESYELLKDYWKGVSTIYDAGLKAQGLKTFAETYGG